MLHFKLGGHVQDYELDKGNSCWISVGNVSVHVLAKQDRVVVGLYPRGQEYQTIAEAEVTYDEAKEGGGE